MATITLRYLGRRDTGKALTHLWLDADDAQRTFDKFGGTVVGGIYTVDGEINEQGGMTVSPSTLTWTGEKVEHEPTIAIWQALDEQARKAKSRRDAARRASKSTELDQALEPLFDLVRACRTRADVQAIQTVVSERITDAWYKR